MYRPPTCRIVATSTPPGHLFSVADFTAVGFAPERIEEGGTKDGHGCYVVTFSDSKEAARAIDVLHGQAIRTFL